MLLVYIDIIEILTIISLQESNYTFCNTRIKTRNTFFSNNIQTIMKTDKTRV